MAVRIELYRSSFEDAERQLVEIGELAVSAFR